VGDIPSPDRQYIRCHQQICRILQPKSSEEKCVSVQWKLINKKAAVNAKQQKFSTEQRKRMLQLASCLIYSYALITRSSAIAERKRCSLFKLWPKYKCEKRASNIALCYGVDVDESSFYSSTAPRLYLMQN